MFLFLIILLFTQTIAQITYSNLDIIRTTPEFAESRGFHIEKHSVTTDDGYVLGIFRLINPNLKLKLKLKPNPVLLWHGLFMSSDSWVSSNPGRLSRDGTYYENSGKLTNTCDQKLTSNLAFTLSSCGYDVWLGNTRGNQYSNQHKNYLNTSQEFWDFSLTELAIFDTKNAIEYVLKTTNQSSLSYIGHSMGTTQMFILLSMIPAFEQFIDPFIALAPVAFLGRTTSIVKYLAPLVSLLNEVRMGMGFAPTIAQFLSETFCANTLFRAVCEQIIYAATGVSYLTDPQTVPIIVSHSLEYMSSKVLLHYGQLVLSGKFRQFDYGSNETNVKKYGQATPVDYPLHKISSRRMAFYRGNNDYFCMSRDFRKLISNLKVPLLDNHLISFPFWNHIDFQYAMNANYFLNTRIFDVLNRSINREYEGLSVSEVYDDDLDDGYILD